MRVLVTGCSTGIGRATVRRLQADGHHVVATARDPADLDGLDGVDRLTLDVTDQASVDAVAARMERLDGLVNNAGVAVRGALADVPVEDARRVFDVNVFGTLRTTQALLPALHRSPHGVVVNVSSVAGRVGLPYGGVYGASKFALEGLSEALHRELLGRGVRVVVIEPGMVDTGAYERAPTHGREPLPPTPPPSSTADDVAAAIATALTDRATPLRVPVGPDADALLGALATMSDAQVDQLLLGRR